MNIQPYGHSGLSVSRLGLGAGQIGDAALAEDEVGRLLHAALDAGITLIDTARGYGLSEERIGRHLQRRRQDFVLSTKVGYGIPGHADWTAGAITAGIDAALQRLRTDVLDIVHLHSCALQTLQALEVIDALDRARTAGKLRVPAYSGENEALGWAIDSGRFGGVECSVSLFDQGGLPATLPRARALGLGVIAKRALGNAPWRFAQRPAGDYCEAYWVRMQALALDTGGLPWDAFALRFAAWRPEVSCTLLGTCSVDHLQRAVACVDAGPLPAAQVAQVRARFGAVGRGWRGEL